MFEKQDQEIKTGEIKKISRQLSQYFYRILFENFDIKWREPLKKIPVTTIWNKCR